MTFARELIALHPLVAVREAMQAASKYLQVAFPEKAAAFEIPSCQAPAFGGVAPDGAAPERAAVDTPSPGEPAADAPFGPSGDGQGSFLCGPWLALSVHDEVSCVPEQCWHTPLVEDMALLDPGSYTSAAEWLAAQVPLWLGGTPDTWEERWGLEPGALTGEQTGLDMPVARPALRCQLGQALAGHSAFQALLQEMRSIGSRHVLLQHVLHVLHQHLDGQLRRCGLPRAEQSRFIGLWLGSLLGLAAHACMAPRGMPLRDVTPSDLQCLLRVGTVFRVRNLQQLAAGLPEDRSSGGRAFRCATPGQVTVAGLMTAIRTSLGESCRTAFVVTRSDVLHVGIDSARMETRGLHGAGVLPQAWGFPPRVSSRRRSAVPQMVIHAPVLEVYGRMKPWPQRNLREFIGRFRHDPLSPAFRYERPRRAAQETFWRVRIDETLAAVVLRPVRGRIFHLLWVGEYDSADMWSWSHRVSVHPDLGSIQVWELRDEDGWVIDWNVRATDGLIYGHYATAPYDDVEDEDGADAVSMVPVLREVSGFCAPRRAHDPLNALRPPPVLGRLSDRQVRALGVPGMLIREVRAICTGSDLDGVERLLPREAFEALCMVAAGCSLRDTYIALYGRDILAPEAGAAADEMREQTAGAAADDAAGHATGVAPGDATGPDGDSSADGFHDMPAPTAVPPVDIDDFDAAVMREGLRRDFVVVTADTVLDRLLGASQAPWRIMLHPAQRRLVAGNRNGPVRVLGGPGVGKTVVTLHRARWLARHHGALPGRPVLFITLNDAQAADTRRDLALLCSPAEFGKILVVSVHSEFPGRDEGERAIPSQGVHYPGGFRAVVVDEAQDIDSIRWQHIRRILLQNSRNLFIAGDLHQSVYEPPAVLGGEDIDACGRSHVLRVDYRQGEEIRALAVSGFKGRLLDDSLLGYRSVAHGGLPLVIDSPSPEEDVFCIQQILRQHQVAMTGSLSSVEWERSFQRRVCVIARQPLTVHKALDRAGVANLYLRSSTSNSDDHPGIRVCRMSSRLKGLEFDLVILVDDRQDFSISSPGSLAGVSRTPCLSNRCMLLVASSRARRGLVVLRRVE